MSPTTFTSRSALATLIWSTPVRLGSPWGCSCERSGCGSTTPTSLYICGIGFSLALEKVPQGGAKCTYATLDSDRAASNHPRP
eukprot:1136808-Lingulodinium_polyedra.AAC.1